MAINFSGNTLIFLWNVTHSQKYYSRDNYLRDQCWEKIIEKSKQMCTCEQLATTVPNIYPKTLTIFFPYFGMIFYHCGCNSFCIVNTYGYLYLNSTVVSLTGSQNFIWDTFSWPFGVAPWQDHWMALVLALPAPGDSFCYYVICPWCWASPKV